MSEIVTGEAVRLDLQLARLPSRGLALLLDLVVQVALLVLGLLLLGLVGGGLDQAAAAALLVLILVLVFVVYPVAFETAWRGRTPGKAAFGLRVVRDDYGPIRFRQALVRGLTLALVEGPVLSYGPAVLTQLLTQRNKRLGDLLAGTVVLRERVPVRAGAVLLMPPPLAGWASGLDLSRLDDELALTVRQFLGRAGDLNADVRESLGQRLAAQVAAVTSPPPPPGTPGWAFLAAVLAERRRREEERGSVPPAYDGPPSAPPVAAVPAAWPGSTPDRLGESPPTPPVRRRGGFAPPG